MSEAVAEYASLEAATSERRRLEAEVRDVIDSLDDATSIGADFEGQAADAEQTTAIYADIATRQPRLQALRIALTRAVEAERRAAGLAAEVTARRVREELQPFQDRQTRAFQAAVEACTSFTTSLEALREAEWVRRDRFAAVSPVGVSGATASRASQILSMLPDPPEVRGHLMYDVLTSMSVDDVSTWPAWRRRATEFGSRQGSGD